MPFFCISWKWCAPDIWAEKDYLFWHDQLDARTTFFDTIKLSPEKNSINHNHLLWLETNVSAEDMASSVQGSIPSFCKRNEKKWLKSLNGTNISWLWFLSSLHPKYIVDITIYKPYTNILVMFDAGRSCACPNYDTTGLAQSYFCNNTLTEKKSINHNHLLWLETNVSAEDMASSVQGSIPSFCKWNEKKWLKKFQWNKYQLAVVVVFNPLCILSISLISPFTNHTAICFFYMMQPGTCHNYK